MLQAGTSATATDDEAFTVIPVHGTARRETAPTVTIAPVDVCGR